MKQSSFSIAAHNAIEALGSTAHSAIGAWSTGGETLGTMADRRWKKSFADASPRLSAETRRNAAHARKVIGGYYARGLKQSVGGAASVVDAVVAAAAGAVDRVEALSTSRRRRPA